MASSLSSAAPPPPPIFEEALLSGGSTSELVLNANGSILLDHQAVSRTARGWSCFILYLPMLLYSLPCLSYLLLTSTPTHYPYCISSTHYYLQEPVTVQRFLCSKPLRSEVSTRKGESIELFCCVKLLL